MVDEEGEATSSDMLKDEVESSTVKVRLKGTSNIASVAADEETAITRHISFVNPLKLISEKERDTN